MVSLSEIRSVIQAVSAPGRHLPLSEFGIGFVPSTHSSASRQARNPVTHGAGKGVPMRHPKLALPRNRHKSGILRSIKKILTPLPKFAHFPSFESRPRGSAIMKRYPPCL
jgi:hypothetical protein